MSAEPIYRCDCGHVGPADLREDGHEVYRYGDRVVYSPNFWECCESCGAHLGGPPLAMCHDCGEREAIEGFDECAQCIEAFAIKDGDDELLATIRDIVRCQAVRS